jgi:hypothetical protein
LRLLLLELAVELLPELLVLPHLLLLQHELPSEQTGLLVPSEVSLSQRRPNARDKEKSKGESGDSAIHEPVSVCVTACVFG